MINHISAVLVIFYCWMLQNRQSHRHIHVLCSVMSHVLFP